MPEINLENLKIDKSQISYKKSRSKRATIVSLLMAVLIGAVVLYSYFFSQTHSIETTSVIKYYPTQSMTILNASGYVVASRKASVAPKVTGMITDIRVQEGSRVRKGDIIAVLESKDIQAQKQQALANYEAAMYQIEIARAELKDAKEHLQRRELLYKEHLITKADYDSAAMRCEKAVSALKSAESSAMSAKSAVASADVALEYTLLRAPFDGVVIAKNADIGDIVTPFGSATGLKAAVATIVDLDSLQVEADVSETNLLKVKVSSPCEVILDAMPDKRLQCVVHTIVPTADRSKASVLVKVKLLQKDPNILPEMTAKVAFLSSIPTSKDLTPTLALSKKAILSKDKNTVVFVIKDDRLLESIIKTGRDFGDLVEVTEGLSAGQKVVLNPTANLKTGSKVKLVEK